MSTILGTAPDRVRPGGRKMARRSALIGALALAALCGRALPAEAFAPEQAACMPELAQLSAQWDALGFGTPQKPSQQIVYGRFGQQSSGPEVIFLKDQLRQAFWDCRHGNVAMARERAALVAERLDELW